MVNIIILIYKIRGKNYYLVTENDVGIKYHKTIVNCCEYLNCGKTTLHRRFKENKSPSKNNPIDFKDHKIYFIEKFIKPTPPLEGILE